MMYTCELLLRREIVSVCLKLNGLGLNQGTAGNVSVRWEEGFLITPSGMPYEDQVPDDIVFMQFNGDHHGPRQPSSEWRFHKDIYAKRQEVNAVIHTHSPFATALAIRGMDIPAAHYMIAVSGGSSIRCAPYATYGTQELSENALAALEGRMCCLLANHGMIATGSTLWRTLWLANEVETLAKQYFLTLQIGGPNLLSDKEIEHVLAKFENYGQSHQSGSGTGHSR